MDTALQSLESWLLAPQYLIWLWHGFLITLGISLGTIVLSTVLVFAGSGQRQSDSRVAWRRCGI